MDDLLVIEDLNFRYATSKEWILKDINLRAKKGEFILLIGPSGCGKTTLINTINGVIPNVIRGVLKGTIQINLEDKTIDVPKTPLKHIATIVNTVFQDPETQFFTLSVLSELAFGPENLVLPKEEIKRRIDFAVKATGIEDLIEKSVMDLSGGQKQRVAIASALTMLPEILILDEPTANLDPRGAKEVLKVIDRLARELNMLVILIEHRLEEVTKYADRVIVMNDGQFIAEGPPKKVFGDPEIVDILYDIGIRPPWHIELLHRTRKYLGVEEKFDTPLTIEEASKILASMLKGREFGGTPKRFPRMESTYNSLSEREKVIEIRNLWYVYPDGTVALKGINLDIYKGEFIGIIGQNGSGKSTLCLNILGLYKPSHGYIKILGKDTRYASVVDIAKRVGMIFQNPDLMLFQNTVKKEIAFGPKNLGLDEKTVEERVQEALEMMRLQKYVNHSPRALSRGQRHRVAVASILSMRPKILIADEPTTGQDYGSSQKYLELLERLNRERGMTIIVVSHSMDLIAKYARRVILMRNGRIMMDGPTHMVFRYVDHLEEADLEPPRVAQIAMGMKQYGVEFPFVLTAEDFFEVLGEGG